MRAFRKEIKAKCECDGVSYTRHHRRPRSLQGDDSSRNISIVQRKQHQSWHCLFSNYTPQTIAAIINEKWVDPDFVFVCTRRT